MSTEYEKVLYFGPVFNQALAFPCTSHVWLLLLKHSASNLHLYILIPLQINKTPLRKKTCSLQKQLWKIIYLLKNKSKRAQIRLIFHMTFTYKLKYLTGFGEGDFYGSRNLLKKCNRT